MKKVTALILMAVQMILVGFIYPFLISSQTNVFPILGGALIFLNILAYAMFLDKIVILIKSLLPILILVLLASCSKVPSGFVGIKVFQLGGKKGVDTETLGPGKYWVGMNEDLFLFPLFKQTYPFTASAHEGSPNDESFSFQIAEGMAVNCDVGVTIHLEREKVATIFQTYQKGIDSIIHEFLRNEIRSAFNDVGASYKLESAYGAGKSKLLKEVADIVKAKMAPQGIIVEDLYLLGDFRLPKAVVDSLNAKIAAIQKAEQREYELREATAESKKKVAIAEGDAKANQVRMLTINDQLIKYEQILNERKAIDKWDGHTPTYTTGIPFMTNILK